ncbi:MAG TPA: hypothetical protein DEA47_04195 [Peptococcaceae bacterium]|nr:MAG: Response regulator receiver protein [Clostridia bacterium 41_269]HBT20550.1 hypothetical protein [Peptococcaceae bacterium]
MPKSSEDGKILVVDDSPLFRSYLKNFLNSSYSLEVEEITSAREFSRYLSTFGLSSLLLIILDIFLPDGDGLEVIQKYREISGEKEIPFIVVSARIDSSKAVQALRAGAKDIMAKPVNLDRLKERIDHILSSKYSFKERKSVREYYDRIRNEVKRAQRGNYLLSLVLAGIFTADTLHAFYKESSYRRIVDLESKYPDKLRGVMRETDSIINLSPSEYLFILPFTDKEGVLTVHKKLENIYNVLIPEEERKKLLLVMGSATFPEDGKNPDELIAKLETDFKEKFSEFQKG